MERLRGITCHVTAAVVLLAQAELAGAEALSEAIQVGRGKVVAVNREVGEIVSVNSTGPARVDKVASGVLVVEDGVGRADLGFLGVGDIISVEQRDGQIQRITILRRAWHELSSPE
jgi:hypothetical protein